MKKSKNHNSNIQTNVGLRFNIENYEVITLEKINEDAYSSVYTCVDKTGAIHILRIIQPADRDILVFIAKGIVIHSKLSNHFHILRIEGYVTSERSIQAVLEYCDGSLTNEMERVKSTGFTTDKIVEIFSSILAAVRFIHSQDPPIIHRGINPKNILCQKGVWKLCNFRCSTTQVYNTADEQDRKLASEDIPRNTNPSYRAPEMVDLYRGEIIDFKSDIWALGCLLFRICTLKDAFPDGKSLQILNGKFQWNQPWQVDEYFKNIVARCLNPNPKDRPTAAQLDDEIRTHFHLNPTPNASEKAVRMTDPIHRSENHTNQANHAAIPSLMNSYSARFNYPQFGNSIIYANRPSQPRPAHTRHISLDYNSYTKALLRIPPPDDEPFSDESDIEVIEEMKTDSKIENIEELSKSAEKFEKEMSEIKLGEEEEEESQLQIEQQSKKRKRRPSVVEISTTIENLIEFGDEPTTLIKNTVNQFDLLDLNNDDNNDNANDNNTLINFNDDANDKNSLINFNNDEVFHTAHNDTNTTSANNNVFNTMNSKSNDSNLSSNNNDIFNTMNNSNSNDSNLGENNTNNNAFNTMSNQNNNNNNNIFNSMSNSNSALNSTTTTNIDNNNTSFNLINFNNNAFNPMSNNNNNSSFNSMNTNTNPFNSVNTNNSFSSSSSSATNMFSSNEQIFAAFENYNKTKNIKNDLFGLDMNNDNSNSFNTYSGSFGNNQQMSMINKASFSTSNINKMDQGNSMPDSTDSIDDLFKNSKESDSTNYKELYEKNPNQLKLTLLKLDDLSLSTALYRFMSNDEISYFILGFVRDSGIKGTRILAHIPALSPTPMNNYLERRKQFAINFPMFEGNFSLFDFAQKNKGKTPPTPGTPPISIDVAKHLIKDLESFLSAFADNSKVPVLAEDGYDAFQTLSYIIAKLRFFNIQKGFVNSSIIPLYNNLHRRILDAFNRAQLNINFPLQPFNFDDEIIIKKLRAPKHRDLYEQLQ